MDTISGIPAHPLFVHVPVVLLPLGALLAIALLVKQAWFERYQWVLLGIVGAGAIGAVLAAASGEELEEAGERSAGIHDHAEAGEMARNLGLVFLLVVIAWIVVPKLLRRRAAASPRWFRPVIAALVVLAGVGSFATVVQAGHSGAEQVWDEGDHDDADHDDEDHDDEDHDADGAPLVVVTDPVGVDAAG
ncbi:MAG: DUF2231 domain-containing protein [Ilumatobacteraceae bacterium]|nr:hypothetical protein [Acidimicrobiales bacterium]MCB9395293.1 hypothetical protein [Acidimicrobiaceae bacterium]